MIDDLKSWLQNTLGVSTDVFGAIILTFAIVFVTWLIRSLIVRATLRRIDDAQTRYQWRKTTAYIAAGLSIVVSARIWLPGFQQLGTFIGLVSAGLAIALKDPLVNLAGWVFVVWRKPFAVGDRIQIGDVAGDVIDLRIFQFTLMEIGNWAGGDQSTGRIIHIPNGSVFTDVLANYSQGFKYIWDESESDDFTRSAPGVA